MNSIVADLGLVHSSETRSTHRSTHKVIDWSARRSGDSMTLELLTTSGRTIALTRVISLVGDKTEISATTREGMIHLILVAE